MLHAILKYIKGVNSKKGIYAVDSANDTCLEVLGYFLTDGGTKDRFKSWIETTDEGEKTGKVVYIQKYGDQMRVSIEPVIANKKGTLVTNKFELLNVIDRFNQLIADSPSFIIIKRDNGKIVLEQEHAIHEGPMAHFE